MSMTYSPSDQLIEIQTLWAADHDKWSIDIRQYEAGLLHQAIWPECEVFDCVHVDICFRGMSIAAQQVMVWLYDGYNNDEFWRLRNLSKNPAEFVLQIS